MQKTLGGDRLGSGKKMQVELHNYERSTHDLGYLWRSTMSAGTLVPFMTEIALPGDTFDIDLDCDIKTLPTVGPLFGSYKVQLDVFLAPIRLYNSLLHNNALGIGLDMSKVKFPVLEMQALKNESPTDLDNCQINPSCVLSYLGIRGIGINAEDEAKPRQFNAIPYIAMFDIYKNYFANKQEEIGAIIHAASTPIVAIDQVEVDGYEEVPQSPTEGAVVLAAARNINLNYTGATAPDPNQILINTVEHGWQSVYNLCNDFSNYTGEVRGVFDYTRWGQTTFTQWKYLDGQELETGQPRVVTFPLENIDNMRNALLAYQSTTTPYVIDEASQAPYNYTLQIANDRPLALASQEGLLVKTYQSDLFNNWLQTEWIDGVNGISAVTAVSTAGDSFTIDTLNLAKKVYDMLNRIAVSGGTYDDWLDAVYAHDRYVRAETPMYMGGLSKELVFQEVINNSGTTGEPLGTLAGRGRLTDKHKGGKVVVKVDEPSYIIGLISLTPRIDYSQGNKWDVHLKTMNDLHKPALDQIGFQDLIQEQMAWWTTNWDEVNQEWVQVSAGKQPAWINYMTNYNRVYGNFAIENNQMFMTLNRRYECEGPGAPMTDLTTYIDPAKFNFIFAETALDAQNFWAQIAVDITARRKMSAKVMPNL